MFFAKHSTHSVALTAHPQYPARGKVTVVSWNKPDPDYKPIEFTHPSVLENDCTLTTGHKWADPAVWTSEFMREFNKRISYATDPNGGHIMLMYPEGLPRNPIGRTGIVGRGLLGK